MARQTIKSLQFDLEISKKLEKSLGEGINEQDRLRRAADEREKATRGQFADLKKRLHDALTEIARLNGYLSRVREDDVVNEPLVKVGDPEGQSRLVPKRKHESVGTNATVEFNLDARRRETPKHWIEY